MGVREETLEMVTDGLSPAEISRRRGVTLNTTLGYVDQLIAQGGGGGVVAPTGVPLPVDRAWFPHPA